MAGIAVFVTETLPLKRILVLYRQTRLDAAGGACLWTTRLG